MRIDVHAHYWTNEYLDQLAGVVMNTSVLGRALVEPDFAPIFAELDRRGPRCG